MSLICEKGKGGIMPLNDQTKRDMQLKHPAPEPIACEANTWILLVSRHYLQTVVLRSKNAQGCGPLVLAKS